MSWFRQAPVTAEMLIVCVALYFSSCVLAAVRHQPFAEAQRFLGAIETRELIDTGDGMRRSTASQLRGPFDVWDGGFWRIPMSSFHHANLIHLLFNMTTGWYVGKRLEQFWGRTRFAAFIIPAIFLPIMAELAIGRAVIGFSGVVSALLGALVVLREFQPKVAAVFPEAAARFGIAALVGFWVVTIMDIDHFANATHFCGFAYGAFVAAISQEGWGNRWIWRVGLIGAYLTVMAGMLPVSRPVWLAKYHWYVAMKARTLSQRDASLKKALEIDPSLSGAWIRWSLLAESHDDLIVAWERTLGGLQSNPSSVPLLEEMRRLWRHLNVDQRLEAEKTLKVMFGKRAKAWMEQVRADIVPGKSTANANVINVNEPVDLREFTLDRKIELPALQELIPQPKRQEQKLPVHGNDAVEGETL